MSTKIVSFGEMLLRFKPPMYERFLQTPVFEATFGGAEANVAISLANYGMDVSYVTVLPTNDLAEAGIRLLRSFGVDTKKIVRRDGRLGTYYLEAGASARPSKVIYDRADSTMALAGPGDLPWPSIFDGAGWFHTSGITAAISQSAADLTLEAVRCAHEAGLNVSVDLNYRKNLWKYGKSPLEIMPAITRYADTMIASLEEIPVTLGISVDAEGLSEQEHCRKLAEAVMAQYPNLKQIATILNHTRSPLETEWVACLYNGHDFLVSREYVISDMTDRIGGGDAFSGALIYALNTYPTEQEALEFATVASMLKYSVAGDYNRISVAEVEALLGGGGGVLQR